MYLNLLSDTLSWGDRFNYMGIGVLVGILVVFSVLALLWLILELFGAIARRGQTKSTAQKSEKLAPKAEPMTPAPVAPVVEAPVLQEESVVMSDDEIVAAITAALAVYLEEAGASAPSINGFRVVSFKKVGNAAHWNQN